MCPGGRTACFSQCADLTTDVNNCGACDHFCPSGETCAGGVCSCTAPRLMCGASCADPRTDPFNCGACGVDCGSLGDCVGGSCMCYAPAVRCGSLCAVLDSDAANCGACGNACPPGFACRSGSARTAGSATPGCTVRRGTHVRLRVRAVLPVNEKEHVFIAWLFGVPFDLSPGRSPSPARAQGPQRARRCAARPLRGVRSLGSRARDRVTARDPRGRCWRARRRGL